MLGQKHSSILKDITIQFANILLLVILAHANLKIGTGWAYELDKTEIGKIISILKKCPDKLNHAICHRHERANFDEVKIDVRDERMIP